MSKTDFEPIKILHVTIGDGNYGGIASFLYSYYSHMDHNKVHFDFLYCGENSMQSLERTQILENSKITTFHVLSPTNNGIREYKALLCELKEYFKKNHYDIVHINTSNVYVCASVSYALKGQAFLIIHSHNTRATMRCENSIKYFIKNLLKVLCRKYVLQKGNYYFACSNAAGENLFGRRILKTNKFKIIHNAIDISKYTYSREIRGRIKKNANYVFGHVGRLSKQKNPEFLVDIFAEIHKLIPNSELWMIGEGELLEKIKIKIEGLNLEDNVVLWGRRDDVADLMQAMDMFLFPSLYEGLSIVTIEAQAAGLPVIASDCISIEHKITNLVQFLPLDKGPKYWADEIIKLMANLPKRRDTSAEMISAGYEINQAAKSLEGFYTDIIRGNEQK